MGKWICGKFQSQSTYYQDGALACMMCGNRTPSRWGFKSTNGAAEIKPLDQEMPDPLETEDDEREEMDMPSKRGICINCGQERSLVAAEMCWKCNGYGQKASGGGRKVQKKQKRADVPAEMPPEKVKMIKAKLRGRLAEKQETENRLPMPKDCQVHPADKLPDPLPIARIEGQDATTTILLSSDPRIVLLDFTLPENEHLYEPWLQYGRSHRRGPGDQAMMAVEEILTNNGLL